MKLCTTCGKEHKDKERNICAKCRVRTARRNIKEKALAFMGGKCQNCGYSRCKRALSFHHLDPTKKDFQISKASNPSWEKVQEELKKCVLLCANCHAEEHEKLQNAD